MISSLQPESGFAKQLELELQVAVKITRGLFSTTSQAMTSRSGFMCVAAILSLLSPYPAQALMDSVPSLTDDTFDVTTLHAPKYAHHGLITLYLTCVAMYLREQSYKEGKRWYSSTHPGEHPSPVHTRYTS